MSGAKLRLLYSRDLPSKSMEVNGAPLNKAKTSQAHRWLRLNLLQKQEKLFVVLQDASDAHFMFSTEISKDEYFEMQRQQSIYTSYEEFPKRLATLLDYCIL